MGIMGIMRQRENVDPQTGANINRLPGDKVASEKFWHWTPSSPGTLPQTKLHLRCRIPTRLNHPTGSPILPFGSNSASMEVVSS